MHNPEFVQENEIHNLISDFEIQGDNSFLASWTDLIIVNNFPIVDFAIPTDHRVKLKEIEKKEMYYDFARQLKKLWIVKVMVIPIVIGTLGTVSKGLILGLEDLKIRGWAETIQTTIEIGQKTEKNPRDLRRLVVTQTLIKKKTLVNVRVKKFQKSNNNNNDNCHVVYSFYICTWIFLKW